MNILAINSSPRSEKESKTALMLDYLVRGMKQAGAEVEVISLREKNIKDCIGCEFCQTRTQGKCILKDDMTEELLPKWRKADIVVYAAPVCFRFFNCLMKRFIDRTFPAYNKFSVNNEISLIQGRGNLPLIAVLAVCGYPQDAEFNAVSFYMNYMFGKENIIAEIYRNAAFMLRTDSDLLYRDKINDILNATVAAGKELVEIGKISHETMTRITQPIDKRESLLNIMNLFGEISKVKNRHPTVNSLNLKDIPEEKRWDMLLEHICLLISEITGDSVFADSDHGFYELGMNDNRCIKFHESLEKTLKCKFPVTMLFKYPTVKSLSAYLAKEIFSDLEGFEHLQYQIPLKNNGEDNINREIEKLSESEAEDALLKELEKINNKKP